MGFWQATVSIEGEVQWVEIVSEQVDENQDRAYLEKAAAALLLLARGESLTRPTGVSPTSGEFWTQLPLPDTRSPAAERLMEELVRSRSSRTAGSAKRMRTRKRS